MITCDLVHSIHRFRRSVLWAGTAVGLFLGPSPVAAQTCPCPSFDLSAVVEQADAIFIGKSLSATTDSTQATMNSDGSWKAGDEGLTRLLFDVQTVIKGDPPRVVEVGTSPSPCGFAFAVGETYLVVGNGQGGSVTTDICNGNVSGLDAIDARAAAIRDILDPPPVPQKTRGRP